MNVNEIYTNNSKKTKKTSVNIQENQIDMFGTIETNIHWNNQNIHKRNKQDKKQQMTSKFPNIFQMYIYHGQLQTDHEKY